eukprot:362261-Chlamydomonas_euryale.AAC.3
MMSHDHTCVMSHLHTRVIPHTLCFGLRYAAARSGGGPCTRLTPSTCVMSDPLLVHTQAQEEAKAGAPAVDQPSALELAVQVWAWCGHGVE